MGTDIFNLNTDLIKTDINTYIQGIFNVKSTITQGSSTINTIIASMSHDHATIISNSNGMALKIDDGTMICWNSVTQGTKNMSNNITTGVYGGESVTSANFTFPVAFSTIPSVVPNVESNGYSNSQISGVSTTSCHVRHWLNYAHSEVTSIELSYIAIGRWK